MSVLNHPFWHDCPLSTIDFGEPPWKTPYVDGLYHPFFTVKLGMATNIRWLYQSLPNGCPLTDPHCLLYIHTCMHASMPPCSHASMHPSIHANIYTSMHPSIHANIYTYMHPCIHANIHTSIHTSIHTYIHIKEPLSSWISKQWYKIYCIHFSLAWILTYMYLYIYIFIYLHIGKKLQAFLAKVLVAMCGHFYTHMRHYRRSHNPCRTHPEMDISRFLRITLLSKILPNSK